MIFSFSSNSARSPRSRPLEYPIRPLQPITVELDTEDHRGFAYPSAILEVVEGEAVIIGAITHNGVEPYLEPGTAVNFKTADVDGLRTFSTRLLRRAAGSSPALVLAWPDAMERVNRRQHVRVPAQVAVDVSYHRGEPGETVVLQGSTLDLSEGGLRVVVPAPIPTGTELSLRLQLPGEQAHVCGGRIVRSGSSSLPGGTERHWVGVEFTNLSTEARRDLRQYIWDIQREHLRRGISY